LNSSEYSLEPSAAGRLRIAGTLDAYGAAALRDALAQVVGDAPELNIDLSAVESCDFSAIQLLCAARASARQAGKPFHITGFSEEVRRACVALGLNPATFLSGGD